MPSETSKLLVQVLRKIPIFRSLSPSQVKKVLSLCTPRPLQPGSVLCTTNTPSDEMYILLAGELVISTAEGIRVASVLPVTTVGEMGVITGQPRSATVEVVRPSSVLVVQKAQFDLMLRDDRDIRSVVYRNIIDVLATKLTNDNVRLRGYQLQKERYEGRLTVYEQRVCELEARLKLAVELAAGATGRDAAEIDQQLREKTAPLMPRILVVDDEPDFRRLVKRALPSFEVVEAEDGLKALEVVEAEKLDLVITDIRMPRMDGCALLAQLRARFPGLPVVAVSGFVDADAMQQYDFNAFIDKPVKLQHLQEVVQQAVARPGHGT
ncbi:MAG: response regulator [Candidatus Latescibacterota bacterium]